jgi:hypothetical protein
MNRIFTLPNELQLHCFSFLPSYKDLVVCSYVCKHFTAVANDNNLWKQWCVKVWHWNVAKMQGVEFKGFFVNLFQATPETTIIPLERSMADYFCLRGSIIQVKSEKKFQVLDISDPKHTKVTASFVLEPPEMSAVTSVMEWRQRVVVVYSNAVFIEKGIGLREFACYHMETAYELVRRLNNKLYFLLAENDSWTEEDEAETIYDHIEIMDLNQPTQSRKKLQLYNAGGPMHPRNTLYVSDFYVSDKAVIVGYDSGQVGVHCKLYTPFGVKFWQAHDETVWQVQNVGKRLATTGPDGIKVWENCGKPPIKTVNMEGNKAIKALGPRVFVSSSSGIEIWDYTTLAKIATIPSQAKSPVELHFIGSKIVRFVEAGLEVFDFAPKSTSQKPSES